MEVNTAARTLTDAADPEADIIFGAVIDESMKDEIKIIVIATCFGFHPMAKNRLREESNSSTFTDGSLDIPAFLRKKGG